MVGRLRSAAKAIELGYAIETDQGRSGRARDWRIAGIPAEVCEIFSKRSDQIAEYLGEMGYTGYRARNVAARRNRPVKRGTGTDQLMPRWIAELEAHGWTVERLAASLDRARQQCRGLARAVDRRRDRPAGRRAVGPRGRVPGPLEGVRPAPAGRRDRPPALRPPPRRAGPGRRPRPRLGAGGAAHRHRRRLRPALHRHRRARHRAHHRRHASNGFTRRRARSSHTSWSDEATAREAGRARPPAQRRAAAGGGAHLRLGSGGRRRSSGWPAPARPPPSTSPPGPSRPPATGCWAPPPAARPPAPSATRPASRPRTMRSLLWRLDHGQVTLDQRTVVVLDEASMTADVDLARLLLGVERAGSKLVIVGDHRQLAPVGPGGALQAVLERHPDIVTVLNQNLRQRDPAERAALAPPARRQRRRPPSASTPPTGASASPPPAPRPWRRWSTPGPPTPPPATTR